MQRYKKKSEAEEKRYATPRCNPQCRKNSNSKKVRTFAAGKLIMGIIKKLFSRCKTADNTDNSMKYLIAGLGNVGAEYEGTRHNVGFMVVDEMARQAESRWSLERRAYRTELRIKGRTLILIKPTTYMNLSGNAVRYWLQKENIDQQHMLVIADEIALPLGTGRLKAAGSNGGHNGLGHIQQLIGQQYPRLRIGIGNEFVRGHQVDWVLGKYDEEEKAILQPVIDTSIDIIKSFVLAGIDITMNQYNRALRKKQETRSNKEETSENPIDKGDGGEN